MSEIKAMQMFCQTPTVGMCLSGRRCATAARAASMRSTSLVGRVDVIEGIGSRGVATIVAVAVAAGVDERPPHELIRANKDARHTMGLHRERAGGAAHGHNQCRGRYFFLRLPASASRSSGSRAALATARMMSPFDPA